MSGIVKTHHWIKKTQYISEYQSIIKRKNNAVVFDFSIMEFEIFVIFINSAQFSGHHLVNLLF
jgi:hypothetical protein